MRDKQSRVNERWKPHLEAAARQGLSVKAYAQANGLNRKTLYTARKRLQQAEAELSVAPNTAPPQHRSEAGRTRSRFAAVRVVPQATAPSVVAAAVRPASGVRAVLPNGIVIECGADTVALNALLSSLLALPCSGRHVSA